MKPRRRDSILVESARLFAERGFGGTSIDALGAAVGISGPGLYRHFRSKEEVLSEMLLAVCHEFEADLQSLLDSHADADDALAALVRVRLRFAIDRRYELVVLDRELSSLPPTQHKAVRRLQRSGIELAARIVSDANPPLLNGQAETLASLMFAMLTFPPPTVLPDPASIAALERSAFAAMKHSVAA